MKSKWLAALVSLLALVLVGSGLTLAKDDKGGDENSIEKIMEKVNKANSAVRKNVRSEVTYKKGREDVNKSSKELAELGKKGRDIKEVAEKHKKELKEWQDLMDKFIQASEKLAKESGDEATPHKTVKDTFTALSKTCTDCHNVFRVDEEDPFKKK